MKDERTSLKKKSCKKIGRSIGGVNNGLARTSTGKGDTGSAVAAGFLMRSALLEQATTRVPTVTVHEVHVHSPPIIHNFRAYRI